MRKILIAAALLFLVLSVSVFNSCSKADAQQGEEVMASDFTLETVDGQKVTLSELTKGREVLMTFWATWCPYCTQELPAIQEFYNQNKEKIAVLGINVGESRNQVDSYLKKAGITFPVALDSDQRVAEAYKVSGIPTIIVVDKQGKIVYYGHSMVEMLERIMKNISNI